MSDWKKESKKSILKTTQEQVKFAKEMLKNAREDIEKRNGKKP